MKTIQHHAAGVARIGVCIISLLGFGILSASAGGLNSVKVKFGGKQFGENLEIHVSSGSRHLAASESYTYELVGSIVGTGDLAKLFPKKRKFLISQFLNQLSPGNAKYISGTYTNPGGKLPIVAIDKTFKGKVTYPSIGLVTMEATIKAGTLKNGQVYLDVTGVKINSATNLKGTIKFQSGSKFNIVAAPLIQFKSIAQNVDENGGSIDVLVTRSGDVSKAVSADYATADDTAGSSDYTTTKGIVTFAKAETDKLITVPITDNAIKDGYRKFTITLSAPSAGAFIGSKSVATIGILDDE